VWAGRGERRDAVYLVLLGVFLVGSDFALKVYADPKINPTLGRRVGLVLLTLLGVLGVVAVLLGCYRLVRGAARDEREARS
jgi:hypothetical protein